MQNLDEAIELDNVCEGVGVLINGLEQKNCLPGEVFFLKIIKQRLQRVAERLVNHDAPGNKNISINLVADISSRASTSH